MKTNFVNNSVKAAKRAAKKAFFTLHNYKVLTKKRAAAFLEFLNQNNTYNMYYELYRMF